MTQFYRLPEVLDLRPAIYSKPRATTNEQFLIEVVLLMVNLAIYMRVAVLIVRALGWS